MKKVVVMGALLALAVSSVQACDPCDEIKIIPTGKLETSPSKSKTVEVIIYNPEYCYSNITDISVSDDANFDVNRSYGDVPCGDASTVSMRGYQYCTVGLTFKPSSTGDFSTDIQVTDRDTGLHTATVDAESESSCRIKLDKLKERMGNHCKPSCETKVNYLAGLNLVNPQRSSHVYVDNKTLVFDEYYEANEGLAVVALDESVNAITRLTFDVDQTKGLFMPRMAGDNGSYYTNDIRHTNRYGFMFPAGNTLSELNFTTWGVGFTGVVSKLSLITVDSFDEPTATESCERENHMKNCFNHIKGFCDKVHAEHEEHEAKIKNCFTGLKAHCEKKEKQVKNCTTRIKTHCKREHEEHEAKLKNCFTKVQTHVKKEERHVKSWLSRWSCKR